MPIKNLIYYYNLPEKNNIQVIFTYLFLCFRSECGAHYEALCNGVVSGRGSLGHIDRYFSSSRLSGKSHFSASSSEGLFERLGAPFTSPDLAYTSDPDIRRNMKTIKFVALIVASCTIDFLFSITYFSKI